MSLTKLTCMYGHLEAIDGKFARDITGYLSLDAGIYAKHGLDISWNHVQGTEERYRRLESGEAQISFVVGRASLQHFLDTHSTRVLGCAMNSCPYYLIASPLIRKLHDLKGKTIVCREGPSRNTPIAEIFQDRAELSLGKDLILQSPNSDLEAFHRLIGGEVQAALLPRPYGFWAEARGFRRITDWPDVVDDPLPISIETTATLMRERGKDFSIFLQAHREGVRYLKTHRAETIRTLGGKFGHSPSLAAKIWDEYLVCMDEKLTVDFKYFERLLAQVAPGVLAEARQIASEWIMLGGLRA